MNAFPDTVCYSRGAESDESFWVVAFAGLGQAALLCIGFPLLLFFAWRRSAASGASGIMEQRRRWWAFLFVEFRPRRMSWLLVAIGKDILVNLIIVFLPGLGTAQLLLTAVVCSAYASQVFCTAPYPDMSNTLLETCTSAAIACVCLFSAGLGFQSEPGVPDLGIYIAGGRSGPGYIQRAAALVSLQGLTMVGPALILMFQLLLLVPECRHRVPARVRPLTQEQREEWTQLFFRVMRLDGGPLPPAVAQLDNVDFSIFQRAVTAAPLTRKSMTRQVLPKGGEGSALDEPEQESAWRLRALAEENAALQAKVARFEALQEERMQDQGVESGAGVSTFGRALVQVSSEMEENAAAEEEKESTSPVQPQLLGRDIRSL